MRLNQILFKAIQVLRRLWDLLCGYRVGRRIVSKGANCKILGMPILDQRPGTQIRLGNRVVLCSRPEDTALGVAHPVILRTLAPGAEIFIGDDTGMSGTTICAAVSVAIGRGCLLGADVMIVDTDFHPLAHAGRRYATDGVASAPVQIGDNVFLGAQVLVLKGVTIGENTVVGAGSVVTRSLPANVVAAGNPAKEISHLAKVEAK